METDVDGLIGAGRHERTVDRSTYRNGYRDRALDTRLGSLQLRIPKLKQEVDRPTDDVLQRAENSQKSNSSVLARCGPVRRCCRRRDCSGQAWFSVK
jgi:putative transposase